MSLDPTTRGIIEDGIEFDVRDDMLQLYFSQGKHMHTRGLIDSIPSFMMGIVFTSSQNTFFTWFEKNHKRNPTDNAVSEFIRIFYSRGYFIKSRILEITSK